MTVVGSPEEAGLSPARMEAAFRLISEAVQSGYVPSAVLAVSRAGRMLEPRVFGRAGAAAGAPPTTADSVFAVASITKPVTATALMLLVEEGRINLEQPVIDFLPEFGQRGKEKVRIRHLLTHTSGLPDMLPQNERLRRERAGLDRFVESICECDLLFSPGTNVGYQSCGIAILGQIVERLTGMPLRDFMQGRLFDPLGMRRTALGPRDDLVPHLVESALAAEAEATFGRGYSTYWRSLGVPWGGMLSTAGDLVRFLQVFLDHGRAGEAQILGRATAEAMTRDQLASMPDLPPAARVPYTWGLGWRIGSSRFGDLVSPGTFGHSGASGTVAWADPVRQLVCVFLTNQPKVNLEGAPLQPRVSNAVAAACL